MCQRFKLQMGMRKTEEERTPSYGTGRPGRSPTNDPPKSIAVYWGPRRSRRGCLLHRKVGQHPTDGRHHEQVDVKASFDIGLPGGSPLDADLTHCTRPVSRLLQKYKHGTYSTRLKKYSFSVSSTV